MTHSSTHTPLPTAAVADAAVRLGVHIPAGPPTLRPLLPGTTFSGAVLVVGTKRREELFALAASILATESAQTDLMRAGTDLRTQLKFSKYRRKQDADPTMTLRRHRQDSGSATET